MLSLVALALSLSSTALAAYNDGIQLPAGFAPACAGTATKNATSTKAINAGLLPLKSYKTFITLGDSYTAGGVTDGSTLAPPVLTPPSPKAGGRTTNGRVWAENIALDYNVTFKDYAVGGAVTNKTLWPSKANASDLVGQVQIFLKQKNTVPSDTTLYTLFFGINDWSAAKTDGDHMPAAAQVVIDQIKLLSSPPTNARSFLLTDEYGRGSSDAKGDAYKLKIYNALYEYQKGSAAIPGFRYAFVDFAPLWTGVLGTTPGYAAFGYKSSGYCAVNSSTTVGACADPDHTFYWISGHPSKQTHRIMADWVELGLTNCVIKKSVPLNPPSLSQKLY